MPRAITSSAVRLAAVAGLALAVSAHAQTNWLPNASGAWNDPANWSAGVPTATTAATFHLVPTATAFTSGPTLSTASFAQGLSLSYQLADNILQGAGNTLTIGSGGVTSFGPGSRYLTNVSLAGAAPGNLTFRVTGGSTLWLDRSTTALTNAGGITIAGGEFVLDNFSTNIAARTAPTAGLTLQSGRFSLAGATGTTTYTVGALSGGSTAGVNTILVNPFSAANSTLQFANAGAGFSTRLSTFSVWNFVMNQGVLGAAGNRITFAGSPHLGANGLLANTAGGGTVGFAVVTDRAFVGGPRVTDFATWNATDGIIRAGATLTGATFASIAGATGTSRTQFNPAAAETATANLTTGSIRITPAGPGASLDMGAFNLVSNAVMLDGFGDFTIGGTGAIGGNGTRYFHVNAGNATLSTTMTIVSGTNPTSIAGPGIVSLTGTSGQAVGQAGANVNRLDLLGGVLRGTNANIGFQVAPTGDDTRAAINFRGGFLEIAGGSNGSGAGADFTRSLGTADGQVRWEGGSGGFGAFGAPASVNINGRTTPDTLQWASANFVQDGFALAFSPQSSTHAVTFHNPIQLDNGAAYALREIRVEKSSFDARAVLSANITGAANADLVKTGNGFLMLEGPSNSYTGATLLQRGALFVNGAITGAGAPVTAVGGALGGDGIIQRDVFTNFGASVEPGPALPAVGDLTINSWTASNSSLWIDVAGPTPGTGYDQLNVLSAVSLDFTFLFFRGSYAPVGSDRLFILTLGGSSPIAGTFNALPEGATVNVNGTQMFISYQGDSATNSLTGGNDVVLYIPAPGAAALLGLGGLLAARRRRN